MTAIDPAIPAPAPATKNSFERLVGVLFAPTETFADIARKPDILVPLLLFIVLGYVTMFINMPRMDFEAAFSQQAEMMRKQNPNMSDSDVQRMENISKSMMKVMQFIGPLFAVIWWLIVALVLFGAFRIMGGDLGFKQSFSATLYAWMPLTIFSIIMTVVIVMRGSIDPTHVATVVKSNPAFLVDLKEQPVLYSLLSSFDVFTIWTIVLLIFGFAAASKFSRAKSAAIVLSLWFVMLVIKVGFAALGAARMNS
jgi:hypothetical protein